MFKIGDDVFVVNGNTREKWIPCPDCNENLGLIVILGNGSQVAIDCDCCKRGLDGPSGKISTYEWGVEILHAKITGIEINAKYGKEEISYKTDKRYNTDYIFSKREDAETASKEIQDRHNAKEEDKLLNQKEWKHRAKTWAWHVRYHRQGLADARKQVEYHTQRLAISKLKSNEPDAQEPINA